MVIQVMRWCDGSYIEDQDKWWLSGIYREVLSHTHAHTPHPLRVISILTKLVCNRRFI
jgi:beta-galactosidase/beta-glucuronidase